MRAARVQQRCSQARPFLRSALLVVLLVAVGLAGWHRLPVTAGAVQEAAEADASDVEESLSPSTVVVFSMAGCPFCSRAKALLEERGVAFSLVDLNAEPQRRAEAAYLSGATTVPQIFVGQRCLGGFDDIKLLDDEGRLLAELAPAEGDGPIIRPTPRELLDGGAFLSPEVRTVLEPAAESIEALDYEAGSPPTLRGFLAYVLTGRPPRNPQSNLPLNFAAGPGEPPPAPVLPGMGAGELVALLRQIMLQLLDDFAIPPVGRIDYASMRGSAAWGMFRVIAAEFGQPRLREDLVAMSKTEQKALLINLYNAMTFHGIVVYGRRSGWWNLYSFYIAPAVSYSLAGVQVSLDDIENGMLRAQSGYFEREDAELQRILRMPSADPRIHMALNCGARSCPMVAVYYADMLEEALDEAVVAFAADDSNVQVVSVSEESIEVALTVLFRMYLADFAGAGAKPGSQASRLALLQWLLPYTRGSKRKLLESALESSSSPRVNVEWLPYDWRTNGPDLALNKRVYSPVF